MERMYKMSQKSVSKAYIESRLGLQIQRLIFLSEQTSVVHQSGFSSIALHGQKICEDCLWFAQVVFALLRLWFQLPTVEVGVVLEGNLPALRVSLEHDDEFGKHGVIMGMARFQHIGGKKAGLQSLEIEAPSGGEGMKHYGLRREEAGDNGRVNPRVIDLLIVRRKDFQKSS